MEERKSVKLRYRAEHPLLVEGGFSQCCTAPATNPFASHCPNPTADYPTWKLRLGGERHPVQRDHTATNTQQGLQEEAEFPLLSR